MRYIVFSGYYYYPIGGAEDYTSSHKDLESAIAAGKAAIGRLSECWWHVLDAQTGNIIASSYQAGKE
jgi:hypothetical protein